MTFTDKFTRMIDDPNVPERLQGVKIVALAISSSLKFMVQTTFELNNQESGYIRLFIGEVVDDLRKALPNLIGDANWVDDERVRQDLSSE